MPNKTNNNDGQRTYSKKDDYDDTRFQQYLDSRNAAIKTDDIPPDIDFTIDGSGAKVAAERARRMAENGNGGGGSGGQMQMPNQNPFGGDMNSMGMGNGMGNGMVWYGWTWRF